MEANNIIAKEESDYFRYILSAFPRNNEKEIPCGAHPRITFSKEVDSSSINIDNIYLLDEKEKMFDYTGYTGKNNVFYIIPEKPFKSLNKYSIKFGMGISLKSGEYLNLTGYSIDFHVS